MCSYAQGLPIFLHFCSATVIGRGVASETQGQEWKSWRNRISCSLVLTLVFGVTQQFQGAKSVKTPIPLYFVKPVL